MTRLRAIPLLLALAALAACEPGDSGAPAAAAGRDGPTTMPSQWHVGEASARVGWPEDEDPGPMIAAIAEARNTAEAAAERWRIAADQDRWAVKWEAPTADGGVEYVWVAPLTWSAFRIEGTLASEPETELACGRGAGAIVAFPVEELADWVHYLSDDPAGTREGGFTITVLEKRFGRPFGG